jgi:hypothetical protein
LPQLIAGAKQMTKVNVDHSYDLILRAVHYLDFKIFLLQVFIIDVSKVQLVVPNWVKALTDHWSVLNVCICGLVEGIASKVSALLGLVPRLMVVDLHILTSLPSSKFDHTISICGFLICIHDGQITRLNKT